MKPTGNQGVSLLEMVIVLSLLGVISVVLVTKLIDTRQTDLTAQTDKLITYIRYAQTSAMKRNEVIRGIKCDGIDYWYFKTTDPDTLNNQIMLPGESTSKVSLSQNQVSINAFTLFFNAYGIPFIAYTDESTNTPVSSINPLYISISTGPSFSKTLTIEPGTGFIQ